MATFSDLINQIYNEQLGRAPDPSGAEYWTSQLAGGASQADVSKAIAQAKEGQDMDKQAAVSAYRQVLGRNPEPEGLQYWLSTAQAEGLNTEQLKNKIATAAAEKEMIERGIAPGTIFTNLQLAGLESDPYAGYYTDLDLYDIASDAENVSMIGDRRAQFTTPVTRAPVVTTYKDGAFTATPGQDVLNSPHINAAINVALANGSINMGDVQTFLTSLKTATTQDEVRNILAAPQAQVVIDKIYGQQLGEEKTLADAQSEAALRQAVLDSQDPGYYQSNRALTDAYRAAGVSIPFEYDFYKGVDTRDRTSNLVNPQNFNQKVNELLGRLNQQFGFGAEENMATPLTGQYYSEAGLQPGFTPFGTPGTTFRSGVAGFVPQSQLPTGFQFGAPPVNATFQQYRPGAFQPAGVTTGGFITGYNPNGTPIYSAYNNPNVNVGGAQSALNPFTPVQAGAISSLQEQLSAMQLASAAQQANLQAG